MEKDGQTRYTIPDKRFPTPMHFFHVFAHACGNTSFQAGFEATDDEARHLYEALLFFDLCSKRFHTLESIVKMIEGTTKTWLPLELFQVGCYLQKDTMLFQGAVRFVREEADVTKVPLTKLRYLYTKFTRPAVLAAPSLVQIPGVFSTVKFAELFKTSHGCFSFSKAEATFLNP